MKKSFFIFLLLIFSISVFSQTTISGVVTYFFNDYQGNKADIGASVILIDSAKTQNFDYKLYENFHYGKSYEKFYFSALERYEKYSIAYKKTEGKKKFAAENETFKKGMEDAKTDMDRHLKEMTRYQSETPEKSAKVAVDLYMQLLKLDDDLQKKTVDANGNYSMNIKPGVYYVLIKSKNRTGIDMVESDGKIYIKKVKISENNNKDISYNFEL